jgi:hypothetical protein
LVHLTKFKNYFHQRYQRSGLRLFYLVHQLLSCLLTSQLNQLQNAKWISFLCTLHPQEKPFWKIAKYFTTSNRSISPLFDGGIQIFNSAEKAELQAHHFEWTHHLNLDLGTANHARIVNRSVRKFVKRPPHPPRGTPSHKSS